MKNKLVTAITPLLIVLSLLIGGMPVSSAEEDTAVKAQSFTDGIVAYQLKETGAISVQEWIDGALTQNAGTSAEWYVLALSQSGTYDFTRYERALLEYLAENEVGSASTRQKYALALIACGSTDPYIGQTMNDSIGRQGIMSWIYGLHLLNNGYSSDSYTLPEVIQKLLSLRLSDGGWAVMGTVSEIDVTAMAIQALSPYYTTDPAVKAAVEEALTLLSARQEENGDYVSYGVPNPESTAQVLVALSALGIDAATDARFVKNGNTLFDGIGLYRLADGSFCHQRDGGSNQAATVQVLGGMVSYLRMKEGKPGLYLLDERDPAGLESAPSTEQESSVPVSDLTQPPAEQKSGGYKLWGSVVILLLAVAVCAVLYLRKKRNGKNFLVVLAVAGAAVAVLLMTDFQTADEYYQNAGAAKENSIGTVTLTIRCDEIPDKSAAHIPDDGILLAVTAFAIEEGDTVYDILREAAGKYQISLETGGGGDSVYVRGIGGIYEFAFGELSGWVYEVNGESPSQSCGAYRLSSDDAIEWRYSLDGGMEKQ